MQNTKNLLVMDKTVVAVRRKIMLCYRKKKKNNFKLWTQLTQMWLLLQITNKSVKF